MSNLVQMAFGKDTSGRIVHIKDAANGLGCGCYCIECGSPLVAKQGNVLDWHFAHAADTSCAGYNPETLLHYRAKHLFAKFAKRDGLHSLLPNTIFAACEYREDDDWFRIVLLGGPKDVCITSNSGVNIFQTLIPDRKCYVELEGTSPCGAYRPDVAVYPFPDDLKTKDELYGPRTAFVGIEIVVTHDVDDIKLSKIKSANDISIRIDLTSVNRNCTDGDLQHLLKKKLALLTYGQGFLDGYESTNNLAHAYRTGLFSEEAKRVENEIKNLVRKWVGNADIHLTGNVAYLNAKNQHTRYPAHISGWNQSYDKKPSNTDKTLYIELGAWGSQ